MQFRQLVLLRSLVTICQVPGPGMPPKKGGGNPFLRIDAEKFFMRKALPQDGHIMQQWQLPHPDVLSEMFTGYSNALRDIPLGFKTRELVKANTSI